MRLDDDEAERWLAANDPDYENTSAAWCGKGDPFWPREIYLPPDGENLDGTWKVLEGVVRLQPHFDNYAATPWPDGSRGVSPQKRSVRKNAVGDDVPRPRSKPKISRPKSDDLFTLLQALYVYACIYRPDGIGYLPTSGRGNRPAAETAFLSAWLFEFEQKGYSRDWLQRATGRKQQSVSQLLKKYREAFPEPEPWASRRSSPDRPKRMFHPNYSTDARPYKLFAELGVTDGGALIVEERSTRVRGTPDTSDTGARGAGASPSARASYLAKLHERGLSVAQRAIPSGRQSVVPDSIDRVAVLEADC